MMINELNTGLIEALKEKKILNLSGFTNTDLKLEYGVGNLTELTDYDNNYVTLSRSLARIAELLTEQGLKKEAAAFLEFGIATHTDIGKNYTLLAGYYMEYGKPEKIDFLIAQDRAAFLTFQRPDYCPFKSHPARRGFTCLTFYCAYD